MNELVAQALILWLVFALASSVATALIYPLYSRLISAMEPGWRSLARLAYATSAPLVAVLSVIVLTKPEVAGLLVFDHCHGDLCGIHAPVYTTTQMILIVQAVAGSLLLIVTLMLLLKALYRGHRQLRLLHAFSNVSAQDWRILDIDDVAAFCTGLWRPRIFLSRGLIERLHMDEIAVVLAHERAHVNRLDNLRNLIVRWVTLPWPGALGYRLRAAMKADAELACDLEAVGVVGSTVRVAKVIEKLEGEKYNEVQPTRQAGAHFSQDDAPTRLAAMGSALASDRFGTVDKLKTAVYLFGGWCLQVYIFTALAHPLIEWLASGFS